ncbi:MAG: di-trans,poly-cis-decaprenylcistransferase [Candidatus Micrarchaeota archaeon]|nr:di-trans,poly-cis-decaprenylcistransferase [Candidatus Micrarchaeota archaeon]
MGELHVAIILDGNRRFARRLMEKPWKGHEWGAEKVRKLLGWCRDLGVKYLTLYSLSLENINKRPKRELEYLYKIFTREFESILDPSSEVHEHEIRIKVIGRRSVLPEKLRNLIERVEKMTENYTSYYLNLAMAYGGQQEITDAAKRIAEAVKRNEIGPEDINEERFRSFLSWDVPYPDIIIRTGGEKRLSNFLLWQCAYSELFFLRKMWPEFERRDLVRILREFRKRQRRFGR